VPSVYVFAIKVIDFDLDGKAPSFRLVHHVYIIIGHFAGRGKGNIILDARTRRIGMFCYERFWSWHAIMKFMVRYAFYTCTF